ncbi:MAG: lysophospholipid acyltransferase family protein [Bacteroidota bacterium]
MSLLKGILGLIFKLYIAVVFSSCLLVFYLPIIILKSNPKTKKGTFKVFKIWSWTFRILTFIHIRFIQKAQIPKKPCIIISNHASYLDIFLMYSIIPQNEFLFLGKSEILSYPLMKSFFKGLNIPVFRNNRIKAAKSFVEAKNALKNSWSLVIFPEGGIPDFDNPKMIEFKEGAFKLAKDFKVPIVPITFVNNHKLFSDPTNLLGEARPGISKVFIHEVISVEQIEQMSMDELLNFSFDVINKPLIDFNQLNS